MRCPKCFISRSLSLWEAPPYLVDCQTMVDCLHSLWHWYGILHGFQTSFWLIPLTFWDLLKGFQSSLYSSASPSSPYSSHNHALLAWLKTSPKCFHHFQSYYHQTKTEPLIDPTSADWLSYPYLDHSDLTHHIDLHLWTYYIDAAPDACLSSPP